MKIKKGQILTELLWAVLFLIAFASSLTWLYEESQNIIEKKRIGKLVNHERAVITLR